MIGMLNRESLLKSDYMIYSDKMLYCVSAQNLIK